MKCSGCGEEFIGETCNFLHKRVTVHNQQIRGPKTRKLKVGEHKDIYAKKKSIPNIQLSRFIRCPYDRQKKKLVINAQKKPKKKQDCLGTGAIRVFTDKDYLTGNCINSLLCTEHYHDVMFS